jgi:hypothetical protein
METIGIRIESGPELALLIIVALVVVPLFAAAIRKRWLRASGRDTKGAFRSTLSIALGVELGLFGVLALSVSETGRKFAFAGWAVALPAVVAFTRSWLRPGERAATFSKTFVAVLGIELAPVALGMLLFGASCFGQYGYVEF